MEISELKTLILLIDTGSITATAHALNRVPSAVTSRIQQLEDHLGTSLFIREKKKLLPTSKALMLYQYAHEIVTLVSQAENQIKNNKPSGRFRLGVLESLAATRLPAPLSKLYETYPDIELELSTGIRDSLYADLINVQCDAIIVADAPQNHKLQRVTLYQEELFIIAAKHHPIIKSPIDARLSTILVFQQGCSYRDRLLEWFSQTSIQPKRIAEMTSYHAILGSVVAGMGIGIVPKSMVETFAQKQLLSLHPIPEPLSKVQIELLWRKDAPSANISVFQECCLSDI